MCGGEETIRIERADNGHVVEAYQPGNGDKPGRHKKTLAMNRAHVLQAVGKHLDAQKGRGGRSSMRVMGAENAAVGGSRSKGSKKKRAAYKR